MLAVSSYREEGFDELLAAIAEHRTVAFNTEAGSKRRLSIADFRLRKTAENLLQERFTRLSAPLRPALARRLQNRDSDPYSLANELVATALEGAQCR